MRFPGLGSEYVACVVVFVVGGLDICQASRTAPWNGAECYDNCFVGSNGVLFHQETGAVANLNERSGLARSGATLILPWPEASDRFRSYGAAQIDSRHQIRGVGDIV